MKYNFSRALGWSAFLTLLTVKKTLSEYVTCNSYENSSRLTRDALGTTNYEPYVAKLSSTFLDSYFIRMVILWNSLPLGFKKCTSLSLFKTNLRAHYKSLFWPAFWSWKNKNACTIYFKMKCRSLSPEIVCCREGTCYIWIYVIIWIWNICNLVVFIVFLK